MSIKATCDCGATYNAKSNLAGKQVKCPKCGGRLIIPDALPLISNDADPYGLGPLSDGSLSSGDATVDPFALGEIPTVGHIPNVDLKALAAQDKAKHNGAQRKGYDRKFVLEIVTGTLAVVHSYKVVYAIVLIPKYLAAISSGGLSAIGPLNLLLTFVSLIISAGILAGGIGVLLRQEWGLQIGAPASYAYFFIMVIFLLGGLLALIGFGAISLGLLALLWMIPMLVADSLGPGLLIFLYHKQQA